MNIFILLLILLLCSSVVGLILIVSKTAGQIRDDLLPEEKGLKPLILEKALANIKINQLGWNKQLDTMRINFYKDFFVIGSSFQHYNVKYSEVKSIVVEKGILGKGLSIKFKRPDILEFFMYVTNPQKIISLVEAKNNLF